MAERFDLKRALNEYIFAQAVEDINIARLEGAESDFVPQLITAKAGRSLHSMLLQKLRSEDASLAQNPERTLADVSDDVFMAAVNDVLSGQTDGDALTPEIMAEYRSMFEDAVGWDFSESSVRARDVEGRFIPGTGYMPISPFDERFMHRSSIMDRGTEIQYIPAAVFALTANPDRSDAAHRFVLTMPSVFEQHELRFYVYDSEHDRFGAAGVMLTAEDEIGLSGLRPYMTSDQYRLAKQHMMVPEFPPSEYMTPAGVEKAAAILNFLNENGYDFDIKRDQNPWQLKVSLAHTKTDIRLTERRSKESYIGRVYQDGFASRFSVMKPRRRDAASGRWVTVDVDVPLSAQETLEGVKYALGYPVNQFGRNVSVGNPERFESRNRTIEDLNRLAGDNGVAVSNIVFEDNGNVSFKIGAMTVRFGRNGFLEEKMRYLAAVLPNYSPDAIGIPVDRGELDFESYTPSDQTPRVWYRQYPQKRNERVFKNQTYFSVPSRRFEAEGRGADSRPKFHVGFGQKPVADSATGRTVYSTVELLVDNDHSEAYRSFESEQDALRFLDLSVNSAKRNFSERVGFDALLDAAAKVEEAFAAGEDATQYMPDFSSDNTVFRIQADTWNILTGQPSSAGVRRVERTLAQIDAEGIDLPEDQRAAMEERQAEYDASPDEYEGEPVMVFEEPLPFEERLEIARNDFNERLLGMFGSFDQASPETSAFSPVLTAMFMDASNGQFRNIDNIAAAMRAANLGKEHFIGSDFQTKAVADRLAVFDESSASPMLGDDASPFMKRMGETIRKTLEETGCIVAPENIMIDSQGIVSYTAQQPIGMYGGNFRTVHGTLGQIFEPDAQGVVETKYNGTDNSLFVPGRLAIVLPDNNGDVTAPLPERMRFIGYEQMLRRNIQSNVRLAVLGSGRNFPGYDENHVFVGSSVDLNGTYKSLYETRFKVEIDRENDESMKDAYYRQCEMTGLPRDIVDARFETAKRMIKFSNELKTGASIDAWYQKSHPSIGNDGVPTVGMLANDNKSDPLSLVGGQPLAIIDPSMDAYVDRIKTGGAKNQGVILYANEGTTFDDETGTWEPSEIENDRTPILKIDMFKNIDHSPSDRGQMASSNADDMSGVAKDVCVAFCTIGGMTFDDAVPISKEFAEAHPVLAMSTDKDGTQHWKLRPLKVGDKICDISGNKAIIGKIIDREMDDKKAESLGIKEAVQLFRDNPNLDIVFAPYSPMSRANAASFLSLLENHDDLRLPDGRVINGGMGFMSMIITGKKVDEKSVMYCDKIRDRNAESVYDSVEDELMSEQEDEDESGDFSGNIKQGGRKISGQLAWTFAAKGAEELLTAFYGQNRTAFTDMREMLITLGMDIDETGHLGLGYHPHNKEMRSILRLPSKEEADNLYDDAIRVKTGSSDGSKTIRDYFSEAITSQGGFMEIPFKMELLSGVDTAPMDEEESATTPYTSYRLPVLSASLRSGHDFIDEVRVPHDYTNQYSSIFENSVKYIKARSQKDALEATGAKDQRTMDAISKLTSSMKMAENKAKQQYMSIAQDIQNKHFEGKHNVLRDGTMAYRVPKSATAVWTPDSTLPLDCIAMNDEMAANMGIDPLKDDMVLVWRDPQLREDGCRYMRVVIDNDLTGVAVNPLIAQVFDGDFDGDTVGIVVVPTKAAVEEAIQKFSVAQTLLDPNIVRENGDRALLVNTKMDVKSVEGREDAKKQACIEAGDEYRGPLFSKYGADDPRSRMTFRELREDIERRVNETSRDDSLTPFKRLQANERYCRELSDWSSSVLSCKHDCAAASLSFESVPALISSMIDIANSGAKGKMANIDVFAKYAGIRYEKDENGTPIPDTAVYVGHTDATRKDIQDTQLATAIKSQGTALGGTSSQRIVTALRNSLGPAFHFVKDGHDVEGEEMPVVSFALRISYHCTQALLQAKHDPIKAARQYYLQTYAIPMTYSGNKMRYNGKSGNWEPVLDKRGKSVRLTPEAFVDQLRELYDSPEGMDVAGAYDPRMLEPIAKVLTGDDGYIINMLSPKDRKGLASPMDELAYGSTLRKWVQMAKDGADLFSGKFNELFAPSAVRQNREAVKAGGELKAVASRDTQYIPPQEENDELYERYDDAYDAYAQDDSLYAEDSALDQAEQVLAPEVVTEDAPVKAEREEMPEAKPEVSVSADREIANSSEPDENRRGVLSDDMALALDAKRRADQARAVDSASSFDASDADIKDKVTPNGLSETTPSRQPQ